MLTEQDKSEFRDTLKSNTHEVYIISFDEMDAILRSSPIGRRTNIQENWQKIKGKVGLGANYYASADDAVTMAKLVSDLGSMGARVYIKNYGGKPHIILKGYPGLRKILTGTRYGIKNPKIVSMGLGKSGAIAAAKQGGILTVVLLSAYRVIDYFLTDQVTLNRLVGTLATDIVKVGIATGASIMMATVAGMTTFAVLPILVVVVVGFGVSWLLDEVDHHYAITERVIAGLEEIESDAKNYLVERQQQMKNAVGNAVDSVIDYTIESAERIIIDWTKNTLHKFMSPLPRL